MYLIERPIFRDMLPRLQHFMMYQYHRLEKVSVSFLTVFFYYYHLENLPKMEVSKPFF